MSFEYGEIVITAAAVLVGFYKTHIQEKFPIFKVPLMLLAFNALLIQGRKSDILFGWSKQLASNWGKSNPDVIVLLVLLCVGFSTFLFFYALILDWKLSASVRTQTSSIIQLSCKLAQCRMALNKRGKTCCKKSLSRVGRASANMNIPLLKDAIDLSIPKSDVQSTADCLTSIPCSSSPCRYFTTRRRNRSLRSRKSSNVFKSPTSVPIEPTMRTPVAYEKHGEVLAVNEQSREAHPAELGYDENQEYQDVPTNESSMLQKMHSRTCLLMRILIEYFCKIMKI